MVRSGTPAIRKNTFAPLRFTLAVMCAVCVLGAVSASAQTLSVSRSQSFNQKQPIDEANPCNGRPMLGEGTSHTQLIQNSSGETTIKVHVNGKAIDGIDDSQRYQYQSWTSDRLRSSSNVDFTITFTTRKHVIHEGQREPVVDGSYFLWMEQTFSTPFGFSDPVIRRNECKRK